MPKPAFVRIKGTLEVYQVSTSDGRPVLIHATSPAHLTALNPDAIPVAELPATDHIFDLPVLYTGVPPELRS